MKEKKITVLVEKVSFETYRTLKSDNIYPLVVETNLFDIFNDNKYYKDGNLYKLKLKFLKEHCWRRERQYKDANYEKSLLEFSDGSKCNILKVIEGFESEQNKDGILVESLVGINFIDIESLVNRALSVNAILEEKKKENVEKLTIYPEVANFHNYEIMRRNGTLPLVIVLTEYENRVTSLPFDGLYIKSNIVHNGKIVLTLEMKNLKRMIAEGNVELEGIKLEDGKVHNIDYMFGGDYDSLGSFSVGKQKEDIMALTKKLLEPKKYKSSDLKTQTKEYPYIY